MLQTDILDFFFTPDGIGWLGPVALVILGFFMAKNSRGLGLVGFFLQMLFISYYASLMDSDPAYFVHIVILLLGGIFACLLPTMLKK